MGVGVKPGSETDPMYQFLYGPTGTGSTSNLTKPGQNPEPVLTRPSYPVPEKTRFARLYI